MAADLHDVRAKVTTETHCALVAYARANDCDVSEVLREVMHKWAMRQVHGASILQRCLKAKGLAGHLEGTTGQSGESLEWTEE